MPDPIIERAARAVCERGWDGSPGYKWENISAAEKDEYRNDARAVLRAIREPSEGMIEEGYASYDANGGSIRDAFMDMIDAALGEE